jgi:hypothetical protein
VFRACWPARGGRSWSTSSARSSWCGIGAAVVTGVSLCVARCIVRQRVACRARLLLRRPPAPTADGQGSSISSAVGTGQPSRLAGSGAPFGRSRRRRLLPRPLVCAAAILLPRVVELRDHLLHLVQHFDLLPCRRRRRVLRHHLPS